MPLLTPVTADIVNTAVVAAMIRTCVTLLTGTPNSEPSPLLICRAPRPSDVVVPNSVANTASTSMILPMGPLTRSPSSGANIWLTSVRRPLRYVEYAMARPNTAKIAQACRPQSK